MSMDEARYVKRQVKDEVLHRRNVVGIGVGLKERGGQLTRETSIIVYVSHKEPVGNLTIRDRVPRTIGSVPTDVKEAEFSAFLTTDRFRPAPPGVSIGHADVTAGTLGCWVKDRRSRELMILSNNHVMANSNSAMPGDSVLQPGDADGGDHSFDRLATLTRWVPLAKTGNIMDCAVAAVVNPLQVDHDILDAGRPSRATRIPDLGASVWKMGRTTGLTSGVLSCIDLSTAVYYASLGTIYFDDQYEVTGTGVTMPGDSGSLVLERWTPVGLLFAGSGDYKRAIVSPIDPILEVLDVVIAVSEVAFDCSISTVAGRVTAGAGRSVRVCTAGSWRLAQ